MTLPRTGLFSRKQPGGVFTIVDLEQIPNDVFFVHSGTGSDTAGYGNNPDSPVATIDYAIGLCTASKGDVIYVLPGHAENLASATACAVDVIGVEIIGIGKGALVPTLTATAEAGTIAITVASVTIKNIKLVAGFAGGCTNGIAISADGDNCTLDGVIFRDGASNNVEWLIHISVATTADDLTIKNCDIIGLVAGTCSNAILFAGTTSNLKILDNTIDVDSSDSTIDHDAGKATNFLIKGNTILNQDTTTAGYCTEMEATSTGHIVNDRSSYDKDDAVVHLAEAAFFNDVLGGNTPGASGEVNPAAIPIP